MAGPAQTVHFTARIFFFFNVFTDLFFFLKKKTYLWKMVSGLIK